MDKRTQDRLNAVYPDLRTRYFRVFADYKRIHGKTLKVSEGIRSPDKQKEMYAQGRTSPGRIITNARPGLSYHQYGLAIDSFFAGPDPYLEKDEKFEYYWSEFGRIAKSYGFTWGGNFYSIKDRPHIQLSYGLSVQQLYGMNTGLDLKGIWNNLDAIRKKLNKEKIKMGGKYSVKNTKEVLDLVLSSGKVWVLAKADGKVGMEDITLLLGLVPKVGPAVKDFSLIPKELGELDSAEIAELVSYVMANLAITDAHARVVIDKSLKVAVAAYELVSELGK